jgi:peroxiredoxin Q/BCP
LTDTKIRAIILEEVFDAKAKKNSYFMGPKTIRQITGKRFQKGVSKFHHGGAIMGKDIAVKDRAPDFEAESTRGTMRLADYHGKKNVLLAFYYKNFTGG